MSSADLDLRLRRLEAHRRIDDLIGDLARAFDAGPSAGMLRPLFDGDAVFVIDRFATIVGRDQIAEQVAGNAEEGFCWTLHYLVSPKVDIDEAIMVARADFYLWEVATSSRGRDYWIGGRYLADLRNRDGAWLFSRLELQAELISHYPEGWKKPPPTLSAA